MDLADTTFVPTRTFSFVKEEEPKGTLRQKFSFHSIDIIIVSY